MYLNSAGFRSIGRVLGVPFQLVYHWVRKARELVEEKISTNPAREIAILEMDELYEYIKKRLGNTSMAYCG